MRTSSLDLDTTGRWLTEDVLAEIALKDGRYVQLSEAGKMVLSVDRDILQMHEDANGWLGRSADAGGEWLRDRRWRAARTIARPKRQTGGRHFGCHACRSHCPGIGIASGIISLCAGVEPFEHSRNSWDGTGDSGPHVERSCTCRAVGRSAGWGRIARIGNHPAHAGCERLP